jgi:hypothetical protein
MFAAVQSLQINHKVNRLWRSRERNTSDFRAVLRRTKHRTTGFAGRKPHCSSEVHPTSEFFAGGCVARVTRESAAQATGVRHSGAIRRALAILMRWIHSDVQVPAQSG